MRTLRSMLSLVAVIALGAAACAGPQNAPMEDHTADLAALDSLQNFFIAAYNAGDAAGLAALWAEGGTMAPPLSPILDTDGILASYQDQFSQPGTAQLEVARQGALFSGDEAGAWGTFVVNFEGPDGGAFSAWGRYASVCQRQTDGSYLLLRHMFNWESPPPGFGVMGD